MLKRSAPTEEHLTIYDQPFKRQREEYISGGSFSQSAPRYLTDTPANLSINGDERQDYDMAHNLQQQLREKILSAKSREAASAISPVTTRGQYRASTQIIYTHASTQTEGQIAFSKLDSVQEEITIAQLRHEAEMRRRKESLALELGYERQVLELRHKFEVPTSRRTTEPSPIPNGSLLMTPWNTSSLLQPVDRSSIRASTQDFEPRQLESKSQASETPRNSALIVRELATRQPSTQVHPAAEESLPATREQPKSQANTQDYTTIMTPVSASTIQEQAKPEAPNDTKNLKTKVATTPAKKPIAPSGPKKQEDTRDSRTDRRTDRPSTQARTRRHSSSGASVNIITSRPSTAVRRDEPRPHREQTPPRKRLTCYFWKNGGCTKGSTDCAYAHYETGMIATNPLQFRKESRRGGHW
ncbi:MAG: hypothetical protein Q9220_001571 [cf. Caloplaca sp. 1 TL-2023]